MSQLTMTQVHEAESTNNDWHKIVRLGGAVAWIQLGCLLFSMVTMTILGAEPTSAQEAFTMLQDDPVAGLLRLDFGTLVMISLFPFVALALYAAFRQSRPAYGLLAMLLVLMGTLLALANHSAFSILHLNKVYTTVETAVQPQILAAGEAILAGNMWNTSAGFVAGLFMQGGFAFISFIMLKSNQFHKATAITGLIANGLDFIHVPLMLFAPTLGGLILGIGGLFYLFWFPLLGRDLYRLGQG